MWSLLETAGNLIHQYRNVRECAEVAEAAAGWLGFLAGLTKAERFHYAQVGVLLRQHIALENLLTR